MTVLSGHTIDEYVRSTKFRKENRQYAANKSFFMDIDPYEPKKTVHELSGMSYGLSIAGYDLRLGKIQDVDWDSCVPHGKYRMDPGDFLLMSTFERVRIREDNIAFVHDKSTMARMGLALQNTVIEPGWEGYITLELSHHGRESVYLYAGQPIAQLIYHTTDQICDPYTGKYQNQPNEPVAAIKEGGATSG